jgi:hypothetical protein
MRVGFTVLLSTHLSGLPSPPQRRGAGGEDPAWRINPRLEGLAAAKSASADWGTGDRPLCPTASLLSPRLRRGEGLGVRTPQLTTRRWKVRTPRMKKITIVTVSASSTQRMSSVCSATMAPVGVRNGGTIALRKPSEA